MITRILTPIDFEQSELEIPACTLELAEKLGAELHLLYVVRHGIRSRFGQSKLPNKLSQSSEEPIADYNITLRRNVQQGSLFDSVVAYVKSESIDMVVMDEKTSGSSSQQAFVSLANRLLESLECPVLLTQPRGEADELDAMNKAMTVLFRQFGSTLEGKRKSTTAEMCDVLAQRLRLSGPEANLLFADLQTTEMVTWKGQDDSLDDDATGTWEICVEEEPVIEFSENSPEAASGLTAAMGLIQRAIGSRATDIHIDPISDEVYQVRFRIDGRVNEYCKMQDDVAGPVVKQLKVMANVSMADPFQPNESRLKLPASISRFEVRMTTAPVVNGEAIALRLIDRDKLHLPLHELGLSTTSYAAVYDMLHRRTGLILIAGPTGAGKTTTAYSMLNVLFSEQQNIVSIEDPVELVVPFMRQLSINKRHGVTMDSALSTVLRMDPDVLFVGEIRNSEAAHVAMQAAGCGKRAFSTMHMRDCAANVTAMRKFSVDARTLAENVSGIITQRLVRRLCAKCAEYADTTTFEAELFASHGLSAPPKLLQPRGCVECRQTGYKDRVGVFEAVVVRGPVAEGVLKESSESELRDQIRQSGTPGLVSDGLAKVSAGLTSVDEIQQMSWLSDSDPAEQSSWSSATYERGTPYKNAL